MPLKKTAQEIGEVAAVNLVGASAITFADVEIWMKIIMFVVTLAFTLDKWYAHRKSIK